MPRTRSFRLLPVALVVLVGLVLGLSGCGGAAVGSSGGGSSTSAVGATPDLDFSSTTVDGVDFAGTTLEGKPTVLWFWAPWCPTCKGQVDDVQAAAARYGDRVQFVGVGGLDDDTAALAEFAGEVGGGVPELTDPDGTVWKHFGITEQSTYVVLDDTGTVTARGVLDADGLDRAVAAVAG